MLSKLLFAIALSLVAVPLTQAEPRKPTAKTSVIFLIGDGLGVAYTSAYRYYQDDPNTKAIETTIFDRMLVGMASTYPDDDAFSITDSAAAATALAAGVKTFNGAIGIDKQQNPVPSMLDFAKQHHYLTGIAVTSQVNHATPAAFVAHVSSRTSYNDIADQYLDLRIDAQPKMDLLLGGGQEYFLRKDRNLIEQFKSLGYAYEDDFNQLHSLKKLPALGLFAPTGMAAAMDSDHPLRLAEMTQKSLELLQKQPFFLMLEASQIDWCGHANDIACALAETHDMAATMQVIKQFIDAHPNTLLVATADHSTGGLSIGAKGEYQWHPQVLKKIKASAPKIAARLLESNVKDTPLRWQEQWRNLTGISLSENESQKMQAALNAVQENKPETLASVRELCLTLIDQYSHTGWTTKGHTGEDVQIFSYGKHSQSFVGHMDNTDISKKIISIMKDRAE